MSKDQLSALSTINRKRCRCFELNANSRCIASRLVAIKSSTASKCLSVAILCSRKECDIGADKASIPYATSSSFAFSRLKNCIDAFLTLRSDFCTVIANFFHHTTCLITLFVSIFYDQSIVEITSIVSPQCVSTVYV